jgi:hypothetical protein
MVIPDDVDAVEYIYITVHDDMMGIWYTLMIAICVVFDLMIPLEMGIQFVVLVVEMILPVMPSLQRSNNMYISSLIIICINLIIIIIII